MTCLTILYWRIKELKELGLINILLYLLWLYSVSPKDLLLEPLFLLIFNGGFEINNLKI